MTLTAYHVVYLQVALQIAKSNDPSNEISGRFWPFTVQGQVLRPAEAAAARAAGAPTRATLVLAPASAGFTDPMAGKPVVWTWTLNQDGVSEPNINM